MSSLRLTKFSAISDESCASSPRHARDFDYTCIYRAGLGLRVRQRWQQRHSADPKIPTCVSVMPTPARNYQGRDAYRVSAYVASQSCLRLSGIGALTAVWVGSGFPHRFDGVENQVVRRVC